MPINLKCVKGSKHNWNKGQGYICAKCGLRKADYMELKNPIKHLPTPQLTFAHFPAEHYTAYAWRIDDYGLTIIENSKTECIDNFLRAYQDEYNKTFTSKN